MLVVKMPCAPPNSTMVNNQKKRNCRGDESRWRDRCDLELVGQKKEITL